MHPTAANLNAIRDELSIKYLERRSVAEFIVLTLLAKQHGFILGPPGTAKSEMIRDFVERLMEMPGYFEALLSRTRPDAALLGPYNLPELRDKGDFHRKTTGFLPTATIAFLDEVGKMSPTSGHDLLSILNERIYHEVNGGRSTKHCPLYTAFTASNELIVAESDDAAAMWDRLLMRTSVDYIKESSNFAKLLDGAVGDVEVTHTTIPWEDVKHAIDELVPGIEVPASVIDTVIRLRDELKAAGIIVSDRRWKQSMRVIQAQAFLEGREIAIDDDVNVLRYTLWDTPEHIQTVERLCLSVSNPTAEKLLEMLDAAAELMNGITERKGHAVEARAAYGSEVYQKLGLLDQELAQLRQDALTAGRSVSKIDETVTRMDEVRRAVYIECLDMDPSQLKS